MPVDLAFVGKKESGKTTCAKFLQEHFGYLPKSFASPLKVMVYNVLLGYRKLNHSYIKQLITKICEKRNDPTFVSLAELPIPPLALNKSEYLSDKFKIEWVNANKTWLRPFLQGYGTDIYRELDPEFWINLLVRDLIDVNDLGVGPVVIDDCRFENEAQALKELKFNLVYLVRKEEEQDAHSSELDLGKWINNYPHTKIENYSSKEELFNKIIPLVTNAG